MRHSPLRMSFSTTHAHACAATTAFCDRRKKKKKITRKPCLRLGFSFGTRVMNKHENEYVEKI